MVKTVELARVEQNAFFSQGLAEKDLAQSRQLPGITGLMFRPYLEANS